jgi:hypothetical protein
VENRQAAGDATPVAWGGAAPEDPFTGSAWKVGPALAGQTQALALQTSPDPAQLVATCQVRQADPATTGRQRRTASPAGLHWVASSWVQAFEVGQAQAAPPPDASQAVPGSVQGDDTKVEQTPPVAVQVAT